MIPGSNLEAHLGDGIVSHIDFVRRHAWAVLLLYFAITLPLGVYAAITLRINSDIQKIFPDDLPQRALGKEMREAFPALPNTLIVVVEGSSPNDVDASTAQLVERLRTRTDLFANVFAPQHEPFFKNNGLLYLPQGEFDALLAQFDPLRPAFEALARNPSLPGLLDVLTGALTQPNLGKGLDPLFANLSASLDGIVENHATPFSWDRALELRDDAVHSAHDPKPTALRQTITLQPIVDPDSRQPAKDAIEFIRQQAPEFNQNGVRIRLTGELALLHDDVDAVNRSVGKIVVLSLILISIVLFFGLRSLRLNLAVMTSLFASLVQTAGFAAFAVGTLSIISSTFFVLIMGLGVDFGLHFCIAYQRRIDEGHHPTEALRRTGRMVGSSLMLCALTTSIAFFAFQVTNFIAIAELGLICGVGIGLSLVASLTLIPAILTLWPGELAPRPAKPLHPVFQWICAFPIHYRRRILWGSLLIAVLAALTIPSVRFNSNPVDVRDPTTESATLFKELLREDPQDLFSMHLITANEQDATHSIEKLRLLEQVQRAYSAFDFLPAAQDQKRARLAQIAEALPTAQTLYHTPQDSNREQVLASIRRLEGVLTVGLQRPGDTSPPGQQAFLRSIQKAIAHTTTDGKAIDFATSLQVAWIEPLAKSIAGLQRLIDKPIELFDLPQGIRDRFVARDGRVRVVVEPKGKLASNTAQHEFADAVSSAAPRATGMIPEILETGAMVARSLEEALSAAICAMILLLLILWRRIDDMLRVLSPLLLGGLLTCATMALTGMSFNFANVIVVPLMLGIGIDTGIHLVHRARFEKALGTNLLCTETTRAVVYSNLTSLASFGSLATSTHLGMASIGKLLFLGITFILVTNFVLLPAVLGTDPDLRENL